MKCSITLLDYVISLSCSVSPEVIVVPSEQTTDNGSTITINCTAEGGPDNVFQWMLVGEPSMSLSSGEDLAISFSDSYSVMTISNVNATQHGGVYRCVVSNGAGNDSNNGTLNVRPVITVQPAETLLTNNGSIEQLQCVADAFPAPEYRWVMIEDDIVIETVSNTSGLMLNPVLFGDEGTYQCVAVSLGVHVNSTLSLVTGEFPSLVVASCQSGLVLLQENFESLSTFLQSLC